MIMMNAILNMIKLLHEGATYLTNKWEQQEAVVLIEASLAEIEHIQEYIGSNDKIANNICLFLREKYQILHAKNDQPEVGMMVCKDCILPVIEYLFSLVNKDNLTLSDLQANANRAIEQKNSVMPNDFWCVYVLLMECIKIFFILLLMSFYNCKSMKKLL